MGMKTSSNSYLDIAELLLIKYQKPMSAREIVSLAMKSNILQSDGVTPWQTIEVV